MNPLVTYVRALASLRPGLRWALALSVLGSAAALLWPAEPNVNARLADSTVASDAGLAAPPGGPARGPSPTSARLPSVLPPIALEQATFDPFVGATPPAPVAVAPPVVVAVVAAPPPPPPPPLMRYRFLGRMVDPSGLEQIYLSAGDATVVAVVGATLDDGYVIEAVGADAITFRHAATGTTVRLAIPSAGESTD